MEALENYKLILETGQATTEKALQLFDALEPVNLDFMFGRWQGSGLHTDHPMDGLSLFWQKTLTSRDGMNDSQGLD
ncbi:MAG: GXWXG domain-containing protein [Xenococcaceae cyanobacterium MO_207.B15]|nr:GXWXG domain-containing protein [Xenococcaceae cyanobacterium MO_207.B15]